MNKILLEDLIATGLSQRGLAEELNTSQANVRYWLKKLNLNTNNNQFNKKSTTDKICPKCNKTKSIDEYYKRYSRDGVGGYCKSCSNLYHTERVKNVKIKMIYYKGGECVDCNLNLEDSHYSVFDFHHLDPKTKDINFHKIKYQKWLTIEKELDKCVLVCANCHRLRHAEIEGW